VALAKIPFTGATEVNNEPPASTQVVSSANTLMGRTYEFARKCVARREYPQSS